MVCRHGLCGHWRFRGGPAKTAVASSALMGMISGSPAANVVTTAPLRSRWMKKDRLQGLCGPGAVAVASTGGMFTLPSWGAAAS